MTVFTKEQLPARERIIIAYDKQTFDAKDERLLSRLSPHTGLVKIGMEAMTARHPQAGSTAFAVSNHLAHLGASVMWDSKFKDITNTVRGAIKSFAAWERPPQFVTIHATMKVDSIAAALEAAAQSSVFILGVTLLTDHDEHDSQEIYSAAPVSVVLACAERLQKASEKTGITAGMVCAPPDLATVAQYGYDRIIKVTPGIRAKDAKPDDQKRTMTAREAIMAGADYLVIGRPITEAPDPEAAAQGFVGEIEDGLAAR